MTAPAVPLAEVTRRDERGERDLVESTHLGHVVVTIDGEVAVALGAADRPTYLRSSVKPIQAQVCLEVLAESGWPGGRPTSQEVAIGWASHRAEDVHLAAVANLCEHAGIDPDQLTCPPDSRPDGARDDERRLFHNCSGKHALFALAGRAFGASGDALVDLQGPFQALMLDRLDRELGGVDAVAVDGCGAPAVRARLDGLARFFGRFATLESWATVRDAGMAHPVLVGGTGRLETALLAGGTVAKLGAEGIYGVGWKDRGRAIGLAVKCEDGAVRAAASATAAICRAAGRDLGAWQPEESKGGGRVVGVVRPAPGLVAKVVDALA